MGLRHRWASSNRSVIVGFGMLIGAAGMLPAAASEGEPGQATQAPTFTRDVAPILQAKCQPCHRQGQVGPFVLETYEQARKRADDIVALVEDGSMPPWKPAPDVGPKLKHDGSLTPEEVATIGAWVDAGAPRGEPGDMPPPPSFPDDWKLGAPDLVLEPAEDFAIPATGPDVYRCFVLPANLPQDVYVTAVEYRPGNRRVVHHLSTFIDGKRLGRHMDAADPGPGWTSFAGPGFDIDGELGFWNAGSEPTTLPDGVGMALPRGSDVILQVHYHPSGKPEVDRTRIGLHFARKPIRQTLHWNDASNNEFKLPAGEPDVEIRGSWYVKVDVEAHAVAPHMHQLGRQIRMSVEFPDGRKQDLIHIPNWDPSWQSTYFFEEPIHLPRGSVVHVVARYDNSAHARNPNRPPKLVRSGYKVDDEMCIGYIAVTKKGQDLTKPGQSDDLYELFEQQRAKHLRKAIARRRLR